MINWQSPKTAPKDTSYFAVLTILGNLEGWIFEPKQNYFRVWSVPGFAERICTTTSTIKGWCRWNEVIEHVAATIRPIQPVAGSRPVHGADVPTD